MTKSRRRGGFFDIDRLKKQEAELVAQMDEPQFWKRADAQEISKKREALRREIETWEKISNAVSEELDIAKLAEKEKNHDLIPDIQKKYEELKSRFEELEFFLLFREKYDRHNTIVAIHAGTGGVDAQDWAGMLLRMILRYCERRGFSARVVDEHRGSEAGIKSAVIDVQGEWAYGYLKSEHGVHRLVRISPYDAEKMRHTSFALIEVLPEIGEVEEVKIDPKDLRIDTYLSSGRGGQGVQTTYSAVRIVHIPTGIIVTCQNERSQRQNKETAMKIMRAKLHQIALEVQQKEKQKIRGEYHEAAWGNQIRSYVLHPYKMVKDHRTGFETSDPQAVLDGKLEPFIEAFLKSEKFNKKNIYNKNLSISIKSIKTYKKTYKTYRNSINKIFY